MNDAEMDMLTDTRDDLIEAFHELADLFDNWGGNPIATYGPDDYDSEAF